MNYANPDMVGHTGNLDAAIKAVRVVDGASGGWQRLRAGGVVLAITADHGNCELMRDPVTGQPHTAHTTNPVPIHLATRTSRGRAAQRRHPGRRRAHAPQGDGLAAAEGDGPQRPAV